MADKTISEFCTKMREIWPTAKYVGLSNEWDSSSQAGEPPAYPGPEFGMAFDNEESLDGTFEMFDRSHQLTAEYADAIGLSQVDTDGMGFYISLEMEQLVCDGYGYPIESVTNPAINMSPEAAVPDASHEELLSTWPRADFPRPVTPTFNRGAFYKGTGYLGNP
ncbi:hypothetical protein [Nesterenkonia halobia]|uniref:Uncharacterized protein n=1 Tax=Nesterenkonia halobia TaxID=37922 RepID=A0ABP6RF00_9MICC